MNLAEYIKDSERAVAKEIFNAKFNSVEDVIALKPKIHQEKRRLNKEIEDFNITIRNSLYCREHIAQLKRQLKMCHTDDDIKRIKELLKSEERASKNFELKKEIFFKKYDTLTLIALSKNFRKSYDLKFIKSKYAL